jgi:hypothetical protein
MPKAQRQLEEQELDQWIRSLGVELVNKPDDKDGFHDALRDGIVLCRLVNVIRPNSVDDVSGLFNFGGTTIMLCLFVMSYFILLIT